MARKCEQEGHTIIKSMRLPVELLDDVNELVVHLEKVASEACDAGRLSGKIIFSNVLRALIALGMRCSDDDLLAEIEAGALKRGPKGS